MKSLLYVAALTFALTLSATAQDVAQEQPEQDERSLMQRGFEMFFEGLLNEVEPLKDDLDQLSDALEPSLQALIEEFGPALRDLADKIDDATRYEAPEVLPNGDIIIRRKEDVVPNTDVPSADGQIEI